MCMEIRYTLIRSNVHNLQSTPSKEVLLNSNDLDTLKCAQFVLNTLKSCRHQLKCAQLALNTLKSFKLGPCFNSNNLHYPQRLTNALNQLKSPFNCIKHAYNQSTQHLQLPNVHFNTSNSNFKNLQASKHLPMPQMCTNAPSTPATPKTPLNTITSQNSLSNQLAINPLTLELATLGP